MPGGSVSRIESSDAGLVLEFENVSENSTVSPVSGIVIAAAGGSILPAGATSFSSSRGFVTAGTGGKSTPIGLSCFHCRSRPTNCVGETGVSVAITSTTRKVYTAVYGLLDADAKPERKSSSVTIRALVPVISIVIVSSSNTPGCQVLNVSGVNRTESPPAWPRSPVTVMASVPPRTGAAVSYETLNTLLALASIVSSTRVNVKPSVAPGINVPPSRGSPS